VWCCIRSIGKGTEVAEWEEPRHPGPVNDRHVTPQPPTMHQKFPPAATRRPPRGPFAGLHRSASGLVRAGSLLTAPSLCPPPDAIALAGRERASPLADAPRDDLPESDPRVPVQQGRDEHGGHQQEHRGHEQERHHELDLRSRSRGLLLYAPSPRKARVTCLGGERVAERSSVARGAVERADQAAGLLQPKALGHGGERPVERHPERDLATGGAPLLRQRTRRPLPHGADGDSRRHPGVDGHPQ
jgi:hypothetical protein